MEDISNLDYGTNAADIESTNEELFTRCAEGDMNAKNELILKNQGLIKSFVSKNSWLYADSTSMTDEDYIQEGNIALYEALDNYDPEIATFGTYVFMILKSKLFRFHFDNDRAIRIPSYRHAEYSKYRKEKQKLQDHLGYPPNMKEIEKYLGYSTDVIMAFRNDFRRITSTNTPIGDEADSGEIGDSLMDSYNYFEDVEKDMVMKELKNDLNEILDRNLEDDERKMLCDIVGWYNKKQKNYIQVSEDFGLTSSKVKQITRKSLTKIRKLYAHKIADNYCGLLDYELKKYGSSEYDFSTRGSMRSSVIQNMASSVEKIIVNGFEGRVSEWCNLLFFSFDYVDLNRSERSIFIEYKRIKDYEFYRGKALVIQVGHKLD